MKTVDNYLEQINPEFLDIVLRIRSIILSSLPIVEEKISYGIPFYYYQGPLCYINVRKMYVDLGFYRGYSLAPKFSILNMENRKQVASIKIFNLNEIDENLMKEILLEAMSANSFSAQMQIKKR